MSTEDEPLDFGEGFRIFAERREKEMRDRHLRARASLLREMEVEYQTTGNPMAVLAAWRLCRAEGPGFNLPLPPWVEAFFDTFAQTLCDWQERNPPGDRLAEEVGNALGFRPGRKGQNPIVDWRNRREGKKWFARFEGHLAGGASQRAAIQSVAEEFNSTAPTVRRRLHEYAAGLGTTPIEMVHARRGAWDAVEAEFAEMNRRTDERLAAAFRGKRDPDEPGEAG